MARPFTAARARNEGYAALVKLQPNTRFVQFIDGDCELVSGWLETALEFFRNGAMSPLSAGGGASGIRKLRFTIGSATSNGTRRLEKPVHVVATP